MVERLEGIGSHPLGFRVAGTPEEREAVQFVAQEMRSLGLQDVTKEPVPVDGWRLQEAFVELEDGTRVEGASFGGVPETGARGVEGELVRVGRGGRRQLDRLEVPARSRSSSGRSRGSGPTTSGSSSACAARRQ